MNIGHEIEKFVKIGNQNDWTGIMAIGDESGFIIRNFGQPEIQLMLFAALIKSFRTQAGEHWDELKYKLNAYMDGLEEERVL